MTANASPPPRRPARPIDPDAIHFLHIGKTGGTAIRRIFAKAESPSFQGHPHRFKLAHLPYGARYFFSIRHPVSRFYSGFYSRKRQGKPMFSYPWSPGEAAAFGEFPHANDLAEALFEPGPIGWRAMRAIQSIQHTAQKQVSWFEDPVRFLELRPPVWIIRQERLSSDVARFRERVQLKLSSEPDPQPVHANDYDGLPPLSEKAKANLERWYRDDIEFYARCERWLAAHS